MFLCRECCLLSGIGLCDELITRPEESYRLWCVVVCDLETSRMRRPWPALGRSPTAKQKYYLYIDLYICKIHLYILCIYISIYIYICQWKIKIYRYDNIELVEWHWQWKTDVFGETCVPVPPRPSQSSYGQVWDKTRVTGTVTQLLILFTVYTFIYKDSPPLIWLI